MEFIILGVATVLGFHLGRIARFFRLPSLIGYMILGMLLGPSFVHIISESSLDQFSFLTDISLGAVAFSIGSELSLRSMKQLGGGIVSIIFSESFLAFFCVMGAVYALTSDMPMALIFGAMAPASAPAGTVAVIQEYRARGKLTKALYAVVGFDDGLAIVIFGFAAAAAKTLLAAEAKGTSEGILTSLGDPLVEVLLSLAVGGTLGLVFTALVRRLESGREILILLVGLILILSGIAERFHFSLILTNMAAGFVLANSAGETLTRKVLAPLLDIMPLLFVWFFCLAGAHLKVLELPALGVIGVVYIASRSLGLIGGAALGGWIGRMEKEITRNIGLGILSQAGVAIGLSLIVRQEFSEMGSTHAASIGSSVITTITVTSILFEIIGPIATKFALMRAGEIVDPGAVRGPPQALVTSSSRGAQGSAESIKEHPACQ